VNGAAPQHPRTCVHQPLTGPEALSVLGILVSRRERAPLSLDRTRLESIARRNRIRATLVGTPAADAWDAQQVADVEYLLALAHGVATRASHGRPVSFLRRLFGPLDD
jgi:hypothetical protein